MNEAQMTELKAVAALLRRLKARIEAVCDSVEEEQGRLPKRLHGGSIDDDADFGLRLAGRRRHEHRGARWLALPGLPARMI